MVYENNAIPIAFQPAPHVREHAWVAWLAAAGLQHVYDGEEGLSSQKKYKYANILASSDDLSSIKSLRMSSLEPEKLRQRQHHLYTTQYHFSVEMSALGTLRAK